MPSPGPEPLVALNQWEAVMGKPLEFARNAPAAMRRPSILCNAIDLQFFTGELRSQRCSGGRSGLLGEGAASGGVEPIPWEWAASPSQPLLPDPCDLMGLPAKSAKVARYAVVGIVAPHLRNQLGMLVGDRQMSVCPTPVP